MEFREYIEKFKKVFICKSCEDPEFLEYMEDRYDEHTSYFPRVRLRENFKTHEPWNGVCEALRDIPEAYGHGYGGWALINEEGKVSNGCYPIEWFEFVS